MKKVLMIMLLCVAVMQPDEAFAAKKSKRYAQKRVTPEKIVEGGFEATGRVTEGVFKATDNILLAVLSIPMLPLYILNEALTADSRKGQQYYYNNKSYYSHNKSKVSRRNVKPGERVWKQY